MKTNASIVSANDRKKQKKNLTEVKQIWNQIHIILLR